MKNSITLLVLFLAVGCTTAPPRPPIDLGLLETGVWSGRAEAIPSAGNTTCYVKVPIAFTVKNGRAVNAIPDHKYDFDVPIREDGFIEFTYSKLVRLTGDGIYGERMTDMIFRGWLLPRWIGVPARLVQGQTRLQGKGSGTFIAGSCPGDWTVHQKAIAKRFHW